ncbi:MAG: hypothetical protein J6S26_02535 [Solobacterium sp.]|nr:hypothetical protein [Solobacterium sp.]
MRQLRLIIASLLPCVLFACTKPAPAPEGELHLPERTEEPEPEAVETPADFSAVEGTWIGQGGQSRITVYDNGGFQYEQDETVKDGYLKTSEQDGTVVYLMYLENNEPFTGDGRLCFDENHPGQLVLIQGMGAVLFDREEEAPAVTEAAVQAFLDDDTSKDASITVIDLSESESSQGILFKANEEVAEFRVLYLDVESISEDGEIGFVTSEAYHQDVLRPGEPLKVYVTFIGTLPNIGFCYDLPNGDMKYFYLTISGKDGSLVQTPFWDF